jgi:hypothetical protein
VLPANNDLASLRDVATGGSGSTATKSLTVQLEGSEASPGSCPAGAISDPTTVNLFIEDDDGDVVIDAIGVGFVCTMGVKVQANFDVLFQGPLNCKDSAVPSGQSSSGDLFVSANTEDGSLNQIRGIKCSQ